MDITPRKPMFLFGYPHVPRTSTGTHDPLFATALYLETAQQRVVFLSADVIFVTKETVRRVRQRIRDETEIPAQNVLIAATHTHSGPITAEHISNDPVVPPVDPEFLQQLEDGLVTATVEALRKRGPAELAFAIADATGIGTSRHDPKGASDLNVSVLSVRASETHEPIGLMLICAMHPTVLHEDSTLYSSDFPAFARTYLQQRAMKRPCPIVYFTGAAGDQSPRHVTRANTFAEAERLGHLLGRAVEKSLHQAKYTSDVRLSSAQRLVDLPPRALPTVSDAERAEKNARARLNSQRNDDAPRADIRTAECDWFGAEKTLALARAAQDGLLEQALRQALPAEVQVIRVNDHAFVGWPGEFFVEFALAVKRQVPNTHVITLANGELQGYVVTQQAVEEKWYEATNAILQSPDSGDRIVNATLQMLKELGHGR